MEWGNAPGAPPSAPSPMPHRISELFRRPKPVVAVLHVGPTPGVPGTRDVRCAVDRAVAETRLLVELGVDGLLVENAHDVPSISEDEAGPELAAYLTRVTTAVKRHAGRLPVGVRAVGGANRTALAAALAASADFVRAEGWAENPARAGALLRYRAQIGAEGLPILADLRPESAEEAAVLAARAVTHRADGVTVLGPAYGETPRSGALDAVLATTDLPVFAGGGLHADNLLDFADLADGFLVGSALKEGNRWQAPVCEQRVRALIGTVEYARGQEVRQ